MKSDTSFPRRRFLQGVGGAAVASGAAGQVTAQSAPFDGWLADTTNFDGSLADKRGQSEVTVRVGTDGNEGAYAFGPPAIRVDPGTTVTFEWTGEGQQHNVNAMEGGSFESPLTAESGVHFEHTFESTGVVKYQCDPHATLGMKGVVVVGDQEIPGIKQIRPDFGGWLEGVDGGFRDARGQTEVTVDVGAQGNEGAYAFQPAGLWVDPGTTIIWQWTGEGQQHNVHAQEGGSFESSLTAEEGFTFEQTLEESGIVTYQCDPHATLGMKGAIAVGNDVPTVTAGGGQTDGPSESFEITIPGGAVEQIAVALLSLPALIFATIVFGGDAYRSLQRPLPATDTREMNPVEEIGHDSYDPIGTVWLLIVYFLILVGLWVFMYFIEFLGNGPTVIG